jgi:hypothetical protein
MTYKPCGHALQHRATVHHYAADRSWARWAEAMTRHDEAMLGYDSIGWSNAIDHSTCGKTNGMGHAMRRLHHYYHVPAFNALASVLGFNYLGSTCRALSHGVTFWAWNIKGRTNDRSRQTLLGKFNPRLEQHTQQYNNPLYGRRVLRSGGLNHVNHRVHPA